MNLMINCSRAYFHAEHYVTPHLYENVFDLSSYCYTCNTCSLFAVYRCVSRTLFHRSRLWRCARVLPRDRSWPVHESRRFCSLVDKSCVQRSAHRKLRNWLEVPIVDFQNYTLDRHAQDKIHLLYCAASAALNHHHHHHHHHHHW